MARELSNTALALQYAAYVEYASRGGTRSLDEWMDGKDFTPEDRALLRAVWTREKREAS